MEIIPDNTNAIQFLQSPNDIDDIGNFSNIDEGAVHPTVGNGYTTVAASKTRQVSARDILLAKDEM